MSAWTPVRRFFVSIAVAFRGSGLALNHSRTIRRGQSTSVLLSVLPLSLCLMLIAPVRAAEYGRTLTVTSTLAIAETRPAGTAIQNYMLVYVNPSAWGTSTCRQDAVLIKKTDTMLLAQLLTVLQTGKTVALFVDDTLRPVDTQLCQVTMIHVIES